MGIDMSRVIVTGSVAAGMTSAHHRDFPEIRAEGHTAGDAAAHLVNKLALALDTALTDWRREGLAQAIADVQAYVSRSG